jgi:hypothetical protein
MFTLIHIFPSITSARQTASLISDYLAFDRHRIARRQYMKAFGGMAVMVLLGAAGGSLPPNEALTVSGMLVTPLLVLGVIEMVQWRRLLSRLDEARAEMREVRKS